MKNTPVFSVLHLVLFSLSLAFAGGLRAETSYELTFGGSGGDLYKEGGWAEARIYLGINALSDVRVRLSSVDSEFMEFPAEILVPAGRNYSDSFIVRFPDNNKRTGLQLLKLTARLPDFPQIEEATVSFSTLDNEIEGFAIEVGPMLERGKDYDLTVSAINFEGERDGAFEAEITFSLVKADGTESVLFGGPKMMTYGRMHLTLAATSELDGGRIKVRGPFGVESISSPALQTYEVLNWDFRDAMVHPGTGNLLATFGASAPDDRRNSLVELSSASGEVLRRLQFPADSKPSRIALSADRSIGYTALDGNYSISQIDMARFVQVQEFALVRGGRYAFENYGPGAFTAMDMITFPGRPNDVLVSQDDAGSSDTQTTFYLNGVPVLQESINSNAETFVPGLADDECFAISSSSSSATLYRIRVSDAGYETLSTDESPFGSFDTKLERIGDTVYSVDGRVASIDSFEELGRFQGFGRNFRDFSMDADKARSYFVSENELLIYDLDSRRRIGRFAFPDVYYFSRVIAYGEGRLLLVTRSRDFNEPSHVIAFDTARLTPRGVPVDLELTATLGSEDVLPGAPFLVDYDIKNRSSATATSVRAELDLSDSLSLYGVEIEGAGEWYLAVGSSMQLEFGDLAGGESRRFTLEVMVEGLANFDLDAFVLSDNPDTDFSNGAKVVSSASVQRIGLDEWSFYDQEVEDAIWEPVSKRLICFTNNAFGTWGNSQLLFFDPASGRLTANVASDASISQMHVRSDGRYLYGATSGYSVLKKLDLQTLEWLDDPLPDLWLSYNGGVRAMVVVDEQREDFVLIGDQRIFRSRDGEVMPSDIKIATNYLGSHVYLPDLKTVLYPFSGYGFDYVSLGQFQLTESGVGRSKIDDVVFLEDETIIAAVNGYLVGTKGTRVSLPGVGDMSALPVPGGSESELSYGDRFSDLLAVPRSGRILFADKRAIESFDAASGRLVRRIDLPGLPSPIEKMVRWGEDGFALILRDGGISFARFDLLAEGAFPFDVVLQGGFGRRRVDDNGNLLLEGSVFAVESIASVEVSGQPVDIAGAANEWSLALSDLEAGSHVVEVRVTGGDGVEASRFLEVYVPSALDSDEDGLLDSWELARGAGAALSDLDGRGDLDGDGLEVLYEFLLGSDPSRYNSPYRLSVGRDDEGWFLGGELLVRVEVGYRAQLEYQVFESDQSHSLELRSVDGEAPEGYERARFRIPLKPDNPNVMNLRIKGHLPIQ